SGCSNQAMGGFSANGHAVSPPRYSSREPHLRSTSRIFRCGNRWLFSLSRTKEHRSPRCTSGAMRSCAPACYMFCTRVVRALVLILGGLSYSGLVPALAQEVRLAPEMAQVVGSADFQEVGIEWMEFDCGERRCLVINDYVLEEAPPLPDSVISDFDKALSADFRPGRPLREADIGATLFELPIVEAPTPQQLWPFLAKLGLTKLSDFDSMAPHLVVRAIGSSEPELLRAFVEELRSRARFQIEDRVFYSREVAGELRNAYVMHGFPSPQRPYFTHLLRGMVTAAEAPTSDSPPYRTVQFQNIEIGTFYYAPIRLVNLGSGPAQVYTTGGFFTGAGVDVEPFTLSPGQEVSRLFRYEAGLMSLFKRRAVVSVIYEAGGVEQEIVRIEGIRSRSLFTSFVSAIRSGVAAHMGYWRDISIYRYTILVVMAGGLLLLLVFGRHLRRATLKDEYGVPLYTEGEQLRAVLDTVRRVTERPRSAIIRLASRADRTSDTTVAGAGVGPVVNGSANGSANNASNGRINGSRN